MTVDHTKFEALCALEASRQLSVSESSELRDHCAQCSSCNERLLELTQLSARLFSEHVMRQPRTRMSKEMLDRFVARGKSEDIPLNSHSNAGVLGLPSFATVALMFVIFLISVTLYLSPSRKSSGQLAESRTIDSADPASRRSSQVTTVNSASNEKRITLPSSRREVSRRVRRVVAVASPPDEDEWRLPAYSVHLISNRYDPATVSRNLISLRLPGILSAKLDQNAYASAARFEMAGLSLAPPSESAKTDLPKLLAAFEYKTPFTRAPQEIPVFHLVDAQVVRQDFDPEAYRMLLNRGLKNSLPVFQFTTRLSQ
jgi:hypothetical protein